jgi:hypothetical protein
MSNISPISLSKALFVSLLLSIAEGLQKDFPDISAARPWLRPCLMGIAAMLGFFWKKDISQVSQPLCEMYTRLLQRAGQQGEMYIRLLQRAGQQLAGIILR